MGFPKPDNSSQPRAAIESDDQNVEAPRFLRLKRQDVPTTSTSLYTTRRVLTSFDKMSRADSIEIVQEQSSTCDRFGAVKVCRETPANTRFQEQHSERFDCRLAA